MIVRKLKQNLVVWGSTRCLYPRGGGMSPSARFSAAISNKVRDSTIQDHGAQSSPMANANGPFSHDVYQIDASRQNTPMKAPT